MEVGGPGGPCGARPQPSRINGAPSRGFVEFLRPSWDTGTPGCGARIQRTLSPLPARHAVCCPSQRVVCLRSVGCNVKGARAARCVVGPSRPRSNVVASPTGRPRRPLTSRALTKRAGRGGASEDTSPAACDVHTAAVVYAAWVRVKESRREPQWAFIVQTHWAVDGSPEDTLAQW